MSVLVRNREQVIANILTLDRYRESDDVQLVEYYKGLIRRGSCFVAYQHRGVLSFGPSRFIGYTNNNQRKHDTSPRDGRDSNPAIQKALKAKFLQNSTMERFYQGFCRTHGVVPAQKRGKYIAAGSLSLSEFDFVSRDIKAVKGAKGIKETEKEQLISARVGQGRFREALLAIWKYCSVTRCKAQSMLRASHIKPWSACNNTERLDPYNGLLLVPNLDQAFDQGLISFDATGKIMVSSCMSSADAKKLGIRRNFRIRLHQKNHKYLEYHSTRVFRK